MPHITRQQRQKGISSNIVSQYIETLVSLRAGHGRAFLKTFFTDTEHIMFAKRLATIHMLMEESSYYEINQKLGVSTSTTKRVHEALLTGKMSAVERILKDKKRRKGLLTLVERISRGGLPTYGAAWSKGRKRRTRN